MKISSKLGVLVFIIVSLWACEDIDELSEFDITEDFNTTYTINLPEDSNGMPQSFTQVETINIASNQQIQDNLDVIQDVTLNSLTYEISEFSGVESAVVSEASLSFADITIAIADIHLQASDDTNTVYTISNSEQLNAIANALENNNEITGTVTGMVSATPVTFDIIVNLDVTVTIDLI
ncbi:hypothetical protein [Winogradskyella aurantia]|uniref:Uncharacterized protein n=1 Tax=Winogradskyella aurantia TaxID=1915063 RepID=A0A265UV72_9FLAO|nr:hypothetical protein [Winogradskyella aurantia]OZV69214.1 hypothetical protein CA834_07080 [Winogradskyella aurantia]